MSLIQNFIKPIFVFFKSKNILPGNFGGFIGIRKIANGFAFSKVDSGIRLMKMVRKFHQPFEMSLQFRHLFVRIKNRLKRHFSELPGAVEIDFPVGRVAA